MQGKLAALAQRGRDGEAAIRRKLQEQRNRPTPHHRLRRLFQKVTGRKAGQISTGRPATRSGRNGSGTSFRPSKPTCWPSGTRSSAAQTKDRAALIERHGIEDRQLSQVAVSREFSDRAAERAARQPETRTITHEHGRGRSFDPS